MKSRLNVICFVTDQQRADHLGCCGNPDLSTPNIDRIAEEGVVFSRSFVANPVCMPNRATMFTGKHPKAHGLRENGLTLSTDQPILPEILRRSGYQTASFGKIHLSPFNLTTELGGSGLELLESHEYWAEHDEAPIPFRGFEKLYFVGGHGDYAFGHYKNRLEREHPGMHAKLFRENALVEPKGWPSSWKMSIPEEFHYNTTIADETIAFLKDRDADKPFFVWCSFPDPHFPFACPEPYCNQYDPKKITFDPARQKGELDLLPPYISDCYNGTGEYGKWLGEVHKITDENYREMLAHTYGMISMVDRNIGRVMETLSELSLDENTVVLYISDHGELLGDHWLIHKGPFLFEGLVRVPTIWRMPGSEHKGATCDELISTVDLCPTLLDVLGVDTQEGMQGKSYRGVIEGNQEAFRDAVYVEFDTSIFGERQRQIRTREWALTYCAGKDYGMLFDLKKDPRELRNLWNDTACAEVKRDLLVRLLDETSLADTWLPTRNVIA